MSEIVISVIVPTFNSERTVERLLQNLFSAETNIPYEVIIVDGNSSDKTIDICKRFNVKIYYNQKVHAAAGRNVGIANAEGIVCAFIDSDCIPCANWINIIYDEFQANPNVMAIGGKMIAYPPVNAIERFSGKVFLDEIMNFEDSRLVVQTIGLNNAFITANCAYKKQHLNALKGFNDFFSNHGEDIDLYWRSILINSGSMIYVPNLIVQHSFPNKINKLLKKYFQYGIASSKLTKVYSKKTINIDYTLYKKLLIKILSLVFLPRENLLYVLQISSHLAGKIYGSIKFKVFNI